MAAPSPRRDDGFTLVELLVAMLVLGLVMTATTGVLLSSMRSQRFAEGVRDEVESVRVAMDRLRKEVRETRHVRTGSTARRLILWLDEDQDLAPQPAELVTYDLADVGGGMAELRRWTDATGAAGGTVVARGLQLADAFAYDLAPQATEVVTISLTAVSGTPGGPSALPATTQVRVRNV